MDVSLTITRGSDGKTTITGSVQDRAVCYALLECGRDAVKDFFDASEKSKIVAASTMPQFDPRG